ncbi:MAG: hypothetical protein ACTSPQ_12815 [Candidatus Helarchaeota archaeon]
MYELTLNNSIISIFDILQNELLKSNFLENKEILKNPLFLYIIKNLDFEKFDLFKNYNLNEIIENCRSTIAIKISSQLEDDLIKKLDLLKILYDFEYIDLQELISKLLEIEIYIYKNLEVNPIIILKFLFILLKLRDIEIKDVFSKLEDFYKYMSKKLKRFQISSNLSKSNIYNYIICLLNNYILQKLIFTEIKNDTYIPIIIKLLKKLSIKRTIDYEFAEILSFNLQYLESKLKINKISLLIYLKSTILEFFNDLFKLERFSIDNFLKIFVILINLKIYKIKLSLKTNIKEKLDDKKKLNNFPTDKITFFDDLQKSQFPHKIKKFIDELEICFNNKCYRACQFYIRLIIETAFYIKAEMKNQLNKFKNDKGKFRKLKEWPNIASRLNFITQTQVEKVKKLIDYGSIGIHNYRIPPNREDLTDKIEILREILYNIFFNNQYNK